MNPIPSKPNVAIVGAGPIGLEIAVALKHAKIDCTILEAGELGHTISWWAPETRWFSSNERISIAGVPLLTTDGAKANREQYLNYLRGVATQFRLDIRTKTRVTGIHRENHHFRLTTESINGHGKAEATAVVLAIGGTDTPRMLNVPGEDLPHVDGYLRETHCYFGRQVLIIGGRNSAVEAAIRLHHAGAHVSLSYRGETLPDDGIKYWLKPEINGLIRSGRIQAHFATQPVAITADTVQLESTLTSETKSVRADDVLSLIGYEQDKTLLRSAGVKLIDSVQRPQHHPDTMETNVPNLYVAGTATAGTQTSKYKTFLENCHGHAQNIIAHLTGQDSAAATRAYETQAQLNPET